MVKRFKANVSIGLLLVGILTVLLAACGSDPTPTPKPAPALPSTRPTTRRWLRFCKTEPSPFTTITLLGSLLRLPELMSLPPLY